jgi:hypothetical protein
MKMKLIAIAAIALSPAVVFGQTRTHIRVTKDGSHATQQSSGDVTTTPAPTPAPEAAPAPAPEPTPAPVAEPAPAPTTTTDSAVTTTTDSSSMKMDSTATPVDTVRVPRSNLQVSPVDSVKMGIPSTKDTERADSARAAKTP